MPSIVSFRRNVGHAVILIILFSFFSLAYPCLSIHPPTFRDHSNIGVVKHNYRVKSYKVQSKKTQGRSIDDASLETGLPADKSVPYPSVGLDVCLLLPNFQTFHADDHSHSESLQLCLIQHSHHPLLNHINRLRFQYDRLLL